MIGTKTITDLITTPDMLKTGRINIIDAPVSAGKTTFALTTLPKWARNPERILYLIDTTNGEMSIQRNIIKRKILSVNRIEYAFYEYGTKRTWGESNNIVRDRMPIMTYAGFGAEMLKKERFPWERFDYIICDEMQNLVRYQEFDKKSQNVNEAEKALLKIAAEGRIKIIAMSATPQKIRKHFGAICYDVPFDRTVLRHLETIQEIPFCGSMKDILAKHKGQTGILYTAEIQNMKYIIDYARSLGIRANGFWSIHAAEPMSREQLDLRQIVLEKETIPAYIDLLVINAASETCIKIDGKKRQVDYMIVHNSNEEVKTQVRGRYHGDLAYFYYHDVKEANAYKAKSIELPAHMLNTRLYSERWPELCKFVGLKRPHGGFYSMPTVVKYLNEHNYEVVKKKDSHMNGQYYYYIAARDTNYVV